MRALAVLAVLFVLLLPTAASAQIAAPDEATGPVETTAPSKAGGASPDVVPAPPPEAMPDPSAPSTTTTSGLTKVAVGIGDQAVAMFDNPRFTGLGVKKVRYFIKWDTIDRPAELAIADQWVARAAALKQQVLMHVSSSDLTNLKQAPLPSLAEYRAKVGALIKRYRPQGVRTWGPMNEANHASQPTWNRPRRAAEYFLAFRTMCKRCTILALDVLDQKGVDRYIERFYKALGRRKALAKYVGIHNYSDTNRGRDSGTRLIIRSVKAQNRKAQFWLTETGGVAKFGKSFPCDPLKPAAAEARQAAAVDFMFTLTRRFAADIRRLYVYNFTSDDCVGRFDSGLVRRDGTARPAYDVVQRQMAGFKR